MTLPLSRQITLAKGTQIPSTLLNNLQDQIIGGKHGQVTRIIGASQVVPRASAWSSSWSGAAGSNIRNGGIGEMHYPLRLAIGERIISWFVWMDDNSVVASLELRKVLMPGLGITVVQTAITTAGVGGQTKEAQTLTTPELIVTDTDYWIRVVASGAAVLGHGGYVVDFP